MKIRNGFVSNSSSSSFVLLGKRIDFDDAEQHINEGKKVIFSAEGWEGPVIIECDSLEMLAYVKAFKEIRENNSSSSSYYSSSPIYSTYLAHYFAFGEVEIDFADLPKNGTASLIGDECDQFSVHDIQDMEEFLDEDYEAVKARASEILRNV